MISSVANLPPSRFQKIGISSDTTLEDNFQEHMMNRSTLFAAILITGTVYAMAQPPGGGRGGPGGPPPGQGGQRGGQPGPGGEHGGPPPNPVLETLDADGDHTISASEILNAAASLKKLDRNRDGQLTSDELHPGHGSDGGGPRGAGGPGAGGPPGHGGAGGHGGPPTAEKFLSHAMTFDVDGDGVLNKAELRKMAAAVVEEMGNRGGHRPGGGDRGGQGGGGNRQRPPVE